MATNSSSIRVIYATGSQQIWTAPDLSFADGYVLQSEFIDVSDIDAGIFWNRFCILNDETITEPDADPWWDTHQRICVITGDMLANAVLVEINGMETFIRDPRATTRCGLLNVMLEKPEEESEAETYELEDEDEHAPVTGTPITSKLEFDDDEDWG